MQLTKGAIGNLINRYKAVLKKCHLMNTFGSLAVAGMLVMGGAAAAGAQTAGIFVNTNAEQPKDVNITGAYDIGVYAYGAKADFSGKQLHIATTPGTGWGSGNVGLWANSTAPSDDRSVINFGQAGTTESINITVTDDSKKKDISIGVWSRGDQNKAGGEINLNAETVTIKGHSDSGWIYGIYAQNATTTTEDDRATININAGKTYIDVTSGEPGRANAIVAMSQGVINIESDLYVNTQGGQGNAIVTRGDSIIAINSSGTHTVQMNGNVNFNYDGSTSGTKVDADVDITLSGADSYWNGNTLISWNGSPESSKLKVSEMTLTVKDGATWTPTAISDSDSQKYTALNNLMLDGGIVDVTKGVAITIENINGKGAITNAGTMSLGTTGTGELGGTIDNTGSMNITGATTLARGSSYTQSGEGSLTVKLGARLTNNGTMTINGGSLTVNGTATFADGSLLAVNGNNLTGNNAAITVSSGGTLDVKDKARLRIDNAQNGQTVNIVDGSNATWKEIEAGTDLLTPTMDNNGDVTFSRDKDASDVFVGMDGNTAAMLNTLIDKGLNNTDDDEMGVRFLSRTVEKTYLGADKDAAAATIESAARIAFAGAVPQMTKMASDAGSNAVVNRLGFANPADGAQAMDAEGKIVDRNTTGFALWIAPLWQSQHGWGMEAGNLDYGFNGNLGGVSLGADYTFENAIRAGITFNIGGGYAESSGGDLNSTENNMSFWGLGAYAGWNYENFGLMADVSYTSTWNDLKQEMDGRMGMGDLEADVQASAISAGLRAEYKLETSVLDVIPHIGVRYMSLNTWGFDAESNGGTVLEGDGFHQDIWTFPVGVTFTKDFTLDSGWSFKPSIDFSVIPAAGDIKAKQDVAFTGLPGTYEVETQMMDYLTWQGGVGLELGNDTMSFGVNYTLQAGQHTTGHGVFGSFRYEF